MSTESFAGKVSSREIADTPTVKAFRIYRHIKKTYGLPERTLEEMVEGTTEVKKDELPYLITLKDVFYQNQELRNYVNAVTDRNVAAVYDNAIRYMLGELYRYANNGQILSAVVYSLYILDLPQPVKYQTARKWVNDVFIEQLNTEIDTALCPRESGKSNHCCKCSQCVESLHHDLIQDQTFSKDRKKAFQFLEPIFDEICSRDYLIG